MAVHRNCLGLFHYDAARPIGSAILGRYADRIGRRFLLVMTIAGVRLMSLLGGFSQRTPGGRLGIRHLLRASPLHGDLLR